ncbi:hypothetical protein HII17_15450 [Thalassotalea sp. M1531]|uniref:Uncharacterized protein n=1 Tax=Thalassotalea algicola TaxID=2716224 RepID=A0A7Y0LEA9_9GAMM|nr:hypothetical protein [Thalassotalea algicola]NMP32953.1 hypothetical protein [Thalassotalea algicola]
MFKKSLIALALTTASAASFAAVDIETGTEAAALNVSIEGAVNMTEVTAGDVVAVLGAEYAVGDIITFTFAGATLDVATVPGTLTAVNGTNDLDVTVGLLSAADNVVTYRVTEVKDNGNATLQSTVLATFTISNLEFDTATVLANAKTTVTYAAETSTGVTIDAGTKSSGDMITTQKQFSVDRSADSDFDAIIDVEEQRLQFTDNDVVDLVEITLVDDAGTTDFNATAATFDIVLNGSFSYLDTDANTAGIQTTGITTSSGAIAAADILADTVTIKGAAAGTVTITIDADAGAPAAFSEAVIPTIDYTATITVDYTDSGTDGAGTGAAAGEATVVTGEDVGEWVLNGSVIEVPYMPMGPNTQPFLRHTNDGSQSGDITLRYMVEGVDTEYTDSVTLVEDAAPGVRNLLNEIEAALLADGYDRSAAGFKVALEITSNVPADDVKVTTGAKFINQENTDRLSIGVISSN